MLATALGVAVGANDFNPWGLPTVGDPDLRGATVNQAKTAIPRLLQVYAPNFRFRHVPFSIIPDKLYADASYSAVSRGCVVGLGYDRSYLFEAPQDTRHVSRVTRTNDTHLYLIDDIGGAELPGWVRWETMESAVWAVDDGLWIIGPANDDLFPNL